LDVTYRAARYLNGFADVVYTKEKGTQWAVEVPDSFGAVEVTTGAPEALPTLLLKNGLPARMTSVPLPI
jgi:hypothetical protein